jgi:SHS2 domain-containing protein
MTASYERWEAARRAEAYTELEHPSDLFLEIRGCDVPTLVENALFALYDHIADIESFEPRRAQTLEAGGAGLDDALRTLLSEALYRFDTEGFVAADGEVTVSEGAPESGGPWRLSARLWGDNADRGRHTLLHEVKAVTYHRLSVSRADGGWRATILLDL